MKRVVIAGGGTGGHFYPGYALGRELKDRGWEPLFAVRREDPALSLLKAEGLAYLELDLRGMPRVLSPAWGPFLYRLCASARLAFRALRAFEPACVVATGGYVSFPAVFAAWRLGIPALLHESNAQLGLANRACLPFASEVAMGLPLAARPREGKVRYELTGTPVRPEFLDLPAPADARRALGLDPARKTLLVFGGSQGARGLNRLAPPAILRLMRAKPDVQCLHLSGPKEEAEVRERYGGRAKVLPYLPEMHRAYAAADLVVCRSGASTIAELIATRKPALLVPFPFAAAGHQETNARALESIGAAACVLEADLEENALASRLEDLLFSPIAGAYGRLGLPPPAETASRLASAVAALAGS